MPKNNEFESQLILLTRPQAYLRRVMGVRDVVSRRFADTWHRDTLQPHWARTIGMWGGVRSTEAILERAGVSYNVFKSFRQRHALASKYGTSKKLRNQCELACSAYVLWQSSDTAPTHDTVSNAASHFGILPFELRTYVDRVHQVLELNGIEAPRLLSDGYGVVAPFWDPHQDEIDFMVMTAYAGGA